MKLPYLQTSVAGIVLFAVLSGCGSPSQSGIALRKENQFLQNQVTELKRQAAADQQTIAGLRDRAGVLPTLPTTRLAELFTTHGLDFGRLTGGADLDPSKPGDEGLAVYVVPVDEAGDKLKAAGTFDVEAFDLADDARPRVGHWHFDLKRARDAWTSILIEYNYALICPWQGKVPRHRDVTVKVTFLDALTQTPFTAQRIVRINLPAEPPPK